MSEDLELFLSILIFLEFFEFYWQKGNDFRDYVKNLFFFYNKGVIFFILLHPSLYFVIFAQLYFNQYSLLASSIIVIKVLDITTKISLMDKLYKNRDLGNFKEMFKVNYAIPLPFKLIGVVLYPTLFFFAFS
ncbi:hypothetical protein ACKGJI_09015 [Sulfurospirillum sp. 1307]